MELYIDYEQYIGKKMSISEKKKKTIVIVDDNPVNLAIGIAVLKDFYTVFAVPSAEKLFVLLKSTQPDLLLLDIDMPVIDGFQTIKILKADAKTAGIPVIFLSANNTLGDVTKAFGLGAVDFITKPYLPPLLLKRLETYLFLDSQSKQISEYETKIQDLIQDAKTAMGDLQGKLLKTVIDLVERRDEVSGGHVERTRKYMEVLLDVLVKNNVYGDITNSWEKDLVLQSSFLYDLGKISIKDSILLKPGKLAKKEYDEVKKHTLMGVKIIDDIKAKLNEDSAETNLLNYAKIFAGYHHEKWDGSGYPYGLKGYNIPLPGRLMAIADVYDALIVQRSYKKSYTHEEALAFISRGKGIHFDPVLVDLFVPVSDKFRTISSQT
jgi:putative two-component system response regulator